MTEDYERTYFEIWGERPAPEQGRATADGPYEDAPDPQAAPALQPPLAPARQPVEASAPQPADELDRKANEVIQRMMVDTLRRIEARLVQMDGEHAEPASGSDPSAVQALSRQLMKMSEEVARFLDRTRRINEELAGLQMEAARNLSVIVNKVKELESRPMHWPPR